MGHYLREDEGGVSHHAREATIVATGRAIPSGMGSLAYIAADGMYKLASLPLSVRDDNGTTLKLNVNGDDLVTMMLGKFFTARPGT